VAAPLEQLHDLGLIGNLVGDRGAQLLAGCPALRNARTMRLYTGDIGAAGLAALLDSPHLANLRNLTIDGPSLSAREGKQFEQRKDGRLTRRNWGEAEVNAATRTSHLSSPRRGRRQ